MDAIGALESKYEALSDDELREQTQKFRDRLKKGETLDDILIEAFAVLSRGWQAISEYAPLRRAADRWHGAP